TVLAPEEVDSEKLVKHLFKQYGIKLVGGQDAAKGKIFRIAHLGYFDDFDMLVVIGAVERGLYDLGAEVQLGPRLMAAQLSFAGGPWCRSSSPTISRRKRSRSWSGFGARRWISRSGSSPPSCGRSSAVTRPSPSAAPPR